MLNADDEEHDNIKEALHASQQRYKTLVESIPAILYEYSVHAGRMYFSAQVENILGYTVSYLHEHPSLWHDSIHPEDVQRLDDAIANINSKPINLEYRIRDASGNWRWFHDYSIRVERRDEGQVIIGIATDITERKHMAQLTQAQLRLTDYALTHTLHEIMQKALDEAEALTDSRIGFFHLLEPDQRILTLQVWSTNTIQNMCNADGQGMHYPVNKAGVWADCIRERKPVIHNDYEHLAYRKGMPQGHATVSREMVVPIMRDNVIVAIMGLGNKPGAYDALDVSMLSQLGDVLWEIIARKKTEIALRYSQEIIALKDRFMSVVSHEFRTPLAIIQTSSDIVSHHSDKLTPERREHALQQIHQQIDVLLKMVDDISTIGRAQSGRLEYYPTQMDIVGFCQMIVEQAEFVDDSQHRFSFINHLPELNMLIDIKLMTHVLTNLLGNATKYSPKNSLITFEISLENHEAVIVVKDEGIGIPPEDQALLFEPFHRATNVGTVKGTGLGLSIVKEYVEMHSGRISVNSTVGQGSTFRIELPL